MKTKHWLILGGVALAGFLAYKHFSKPAMKMMDADDSSNASGNMGTNCKCKNGFTGYCASGNCAKCCGKMGYDSSVR